MATTVHHPPTLSQEPGTPADEWAQQTVGAVDGAAQTTRQNPVYGTSGVHDALGTDSLAGNKSNVTTPGNELPGAFPRSTSTTGAPITTTIAETAQSALASAQQTAASAQQQAAPVLQSAAESATGYLASAGQAARQYLPSSVIGTLEGAGVMGGPGLQTTNTNANVTSLPLPSQETTFTPSTVGVGSLPGTASEADVAKLPEERALESKIGGTVGREGALGAGVTGGAGSGVSGAPPGLDRNISSGADSKEPTFEKWPTPGLTSEVPDLRTVSSPHTGTTHRPSGTMTSPDSDAQAAAAAVGNTTTAGHGSTGSTSEDRDKPPPTPANSSTVDSADNHTSHARDQVNRGPARTEPSQDYTEPASNVDQLDQHATGKEMRRESEPVKPDDDAERASTGTTGSSGGKTSLKQKIKGEVKVLAGKMGKDPKKVEAGKALKEGHAA